jgi:glycosyltransferase involved in cell wall biosynthesis
MLEQYISEQTRRIGHADILVGIPSYNNVRTIGHVVKAVQAGLAKYFPNDKSVIANSDGGSKDGTVEIVQNTSIEDLRTILIHHSPERLYKIAIPYHGIPGKGSAFRAIFEIAQALGVNACAVVDSDLRSITPEWVELLLDPIISGSFDYVAPLYKRHKYDGTITNSIIYPFTRALYGKRVRQPIGGDFGFSRKLAEFYLSRNVWETDVARYGIDIWMTTTAIANNFKVCQSFLGAKIHDPKDPSADLSSMLYQVVGATFNLMEEYYNIWSQITSSEVVPTFGFEYEVGLEPVSVNLERMIDRFKLGVKELPAILNDPMLPHRTAQLALAEALSRHIPYDFEMNSQDNSKKFCSEVVSDAYSKAGLSLWSKMSHIASPGVVSWLASFGVTNFDTQKPSDLEYDPKLTVVAEWRDIETLYKDHLDNAVIDVMLEGAENGERLTYNAYLLPLARVLKAYSWLLNQLGRIGPIPEGMSAEKALRNARLSKRHEKIKTRTLALATKFQSENHYRPPYWQLIELARQAKTEIDK